MKKNLLHLAFLLPSQGKELLTVVNQVFSLFKDYLQDQLETKTKEIEQKSRIDKEVVQLKFKGNQKQFELNAEIDSILEIIETESQRAQPNQERIQKLAKNGRLLIRKRQKLIKIADKSKDGWQVVAEYESDELASGSDDKAWEAAGRKRRQKEQAGGDQQKKQRRGSSPDNQLLCGEVLFLECLVYFVFHNDFGSACVSYHISCLFDCLWGFKCKIIYVRLSAAN